MKTLVIIFLMLTGIIARAQSIPLMIVGNPKGPPSQMTLPQLKSVFRGEKAYWSDGTKIVLAMLKFNTETGASTCEKIYNMTPEKVKRFWLELSFGGKADPPVFFNNAGELLEFVRKHPGAVGIMDQSLPDTDNLVVFIDGKKTF